MKKKKTEISLSTLRQEKGMSQSDLAKELGVSTSLIGMYETGKRNPSLDKAILIANYFNISVEDIDFSK